MKALEFYPLLLVHLRDALESFAKRASIERAALDRFLGDILTAAAREELGFDPEIAALVCVQAALYLLFGGGMDRDEGEHIANRWIQRVGLDYKRKGCKRKGKVIPINKESGE